MILGTLLALVRRAAPPAAEPATDPSAALVRRALDGDRAAFDELYRLHVAGTYRLLTRLIGPVPDRDDLVQQVFLEAFRSLPRFRGEAAFATWLHRIVVNLAYRHLRRGRRDTWHDIPDDLRATGATPEQSARQREELARALRLLAGLKPKKRIAYVLRVVEGLSLDEIGALVGATAPAVGQRIKHAQRELAAMVERERRRTQEAP